MAYIIVPFVYIFYGIDVKFSSLLSLSFLTRKALGALDLTINPHPGLMEKKL